MLVELNNPVVTSASTPHKGAVNMSKEKAPVEIVVAEFHTVEAASAALKTLKSKMSLKDAAIVRNENGKVKVKETKDMGGGKGASVGVVLAAVLGLFTGLTWVGLGAAALTSGLVAKLHDANLSNKQLKSIGAALQSNQSVLVVVVEQGQGEMVKAALAAVGAAAIVEGLSEDVVAQLEEHPAPIATAPSD
jgi:uncharacterized membrane protein